MNVNQSLIALAGSDLKRKRKPIEDSDSNDAINARMYVYLKKRQAVRMELPEETNINISSNPSYHLPEARWDDSFKGKHWWDMPGQDADCQKLNFFLFRRGLYEAASQKESIHRARMIAIAVRKSKKLKQARYDAARYEQLGRPAGRLVRQVEQAGAATTDHY